MPELVYTKFKNSMWILFGAQVLLGVEDRQLLLIDDMVCTHQSFETKHYFDYAFPSQRANVTAGSLQARNPLSRVS